ncbi:MAG: efflux transporter outer membrane subunit [Desulfovibrio sp.]|jgi:NodT family efflux transporter outer membrane factor (OMF) lipoprotein|nr:efflux transporter outer membrane subunit [Desulfovibrio sp.]
MRLKDGKRGRSRAAGVTRTARLMHSGLCCPREASGVGRAVNLYCCILLLGLSGACVNLSPDYAPPPLPGGMPAAYKEDGRQQSVPAQVPTPGRWWEIFEDPVLDNLMLRMNGANQNLAAAAAAMRGAAAASDAARSALFPIFSVPVSAPRSGGENMRAGGRYSGGLQSSWEISFWNALPAYEAAGAEAEASAADFAAARLLMQSDLALNYFQLRSLDSRRELYESTIEAYKRAAALTDSQFRGGMVTRMDLDQARAQLADAQAQLAALERQRAELEHAIAVLCGQSPSGFSLPRASTAVRVPALPTELPSALLERRPDIAAAERRVAAANKRIGIARAAWFPSFTLGADVLWQAAQWRDAALYTWTLGPSGALTLFQGGRRIADNEAAVAAYDAVAAQYRQAVLQAIREVEDALSDLRYLEREAESRATAARAARSALRIALSQYQGGLTTYLQVVSVQTTALANESSAIEVRGQRLAAAVNLVKALGGGFDAGEIQRLLR